MSKRKPMPARRPSKGKKARVIFLMCILPVLAIFWGRVFLSGAPKAANAASNAATTSPQVPQTAATPADSPAELMVVRIIRPAATGRDLFSFDPTAYEQNSLETQDSRIGQGTFNNTRADKDPADKALTDLVLQGTILGESPVALISGRPFKVGETINGFTVEKIEERHIVLEKDGVQKSLSMGSEK